MKKVREKTQAFIAKTHIPVWLAILLAVVIVLRIPNLFEPYSYGDETIYLTLGQGVRQGLTLYKDLHDNKPPLLYLITAVAGNIFWFKAILLFWSLVTIVVFWHLVKTLIPNKDSVQKIATIIFGILTTIPLFEGNIANAEIFMIGPTILAFFLLFSRKLDAKNIFLAGVLFSVAALFKIPAVFDMFAVVAFWLIMNGLKKDDLLKTVKRGLVLFGGFLTPIAITFIYFLFKGAFKDYFVAAFLQNFGYLSSWRGAGPQAPLLVQNLPLIIRALVVLVGAAILWLKRKGLSNHFIFLSLWLLFGLFAVTLSERPYPHYLMQIVPELAIFLGILIADRTIEQTLTIIPLLLAVSVPVAYKFWYYPTTPYYLKFVRFATRMIDKKTYFSTFGSRINTDYAIADFVVSSTGPKDRIFVWGSDSSNIYALTRRLPPIKYVADYHITDFSDKAVEAKKIMTAKPALIIILPNANSDQIGANSFKELIPTLKSSYLPIITIDGAEIWHIRTSKAK